MFYEEKANKLYDIYYCFLSFILFVDNGVLCYKQVWCTKAPGESIKVAQRCCTYTGPEKTVERFNQRLDAVELTIKTPGGLIRYEGFEVLNAFKKKDDTILFKRI